MPADTAFALLVQAASTPSVAAANSAIEAYREACIEGSLKLSPSRGRIVKPDAHLDVVDFVTPDGSIASQTAVELYGARSTFLIITEYQRLQPKSIAKSCVLVSRSVSKREAMAAYLEGIPEKVVTPDWIPNMYLSTWTSDHPELGFRKKLGSRENGRIVLAIGTHPTTRNQTNAGTTKQ